MGEKPKHKKYHRYPPGVTPPAIQRRVERLKEKNERRLALQQAPPARLVLLTARDVADLRDKVAALEALVQRTTAKLHDAKVRYHAGLQFLRPGAKLDALYPPKEQDADVAE